MQRRKEYSIWVLWLVVVVSVSLVFGCTSMGFGYDLKELKRSVTFKTQCPVDKIKVVEAMEAGVGHSKFKLDVCGKSQDWNRMGSSYFQEGHGPLDPAAPVPQSNAKNQEIRAEPQAIDSETKVEQSQESQLASVPQEPKQSQVTPARTMQSNGDCCCSLADYQSLLKRVADLELKIAGEKTNLELIEDLKDPRDMAWSLRCQAAKKLGERKAREAIVPLEQVIASPAFSSSLKREAQAALNKIQGQY